jgi:hypothetical protein
MKYAIAIREFFAALFGSKLVVQLRTDLEEARRERDYFRGRNERLELMILPQRTTPQTKRTDWRRDNPGGVTQVGGRKSWAMIEHENTLRINAEIAAEAAAKKNSEQSEPTN